MYRMQLASDVRRDGLALELVTADGTVVAEVFRADSDHELRFTAYVADLPAVEVERLLARARAELGPFEDGSPLPAPVPT